MAEPLLQPDKIIFRDFKLLKGQVEGAFDFKSKRIKSYNTDLGFVMAFQPAQGVIKADLQIGIKTNSEGRNKSEASGFFHFAFVYEVLNFSDLAQIEPGSQNVVLHPWLANAIASISFSTARGILMARFQGTALRDFILPVIDPNSLFASENKA